MRLLVAVSTALLCIAPRSFAYDDTYAGCSTVTWEIFHAVNDYVLGVPLEKAASAAVKRENVVTTYEMAKTKGIDEAYIAGHVFYNQCARDVPRTEAALAPTEAAYRECALKNGHRSQILARIKKGVPIAETKKLMPTQFHELIDVMYKTASEYSLNKAAAQSAESAMSCIAAVRS